MTLRSAIVILLAAAVPLAWLAAGTGDAVSQSETFVRVTNFPDLQEVTGTVRVEALESFGSLVTLEATNVSPVPRSATTRLIDGGVIETDGYSHVVLSLFGEVRGELTRPGTLGAILIPDTETSEKLLKTKSVFLFPVEVAAALTPDGQSVFQSNQIRVVVGFPSYRVLFWNSTDRTVVTTLSAYRTK